jgi:hypothetical protein
MRHITQWAMVWLVLLLVTDVVCADKRAEREIRAGYDRIVQYTKSA